ncbi:MAG: hypothetical protein HND58_15770 [Planctomycetota bacterium]|nr:MAG: hypothetical protein HND58_15770 [Planctomycetota bacterium]
MPMFRVWVADRATGKESHITVEADDKHDAMTKVQDGNTLVADAVEVSEPASTPNDRLAVVIDGARRVLGRFGVDPSPTEIAGRASELLQQFEAVPSANDLAWAVLTDMGIRARSHGDLKDVFDAQARFLATEGRDHRDAQRRSYENELKHLAGSGVDRVEILANDGCAECARQNGERWAVQDALAQMPLPCSGCTNTGVYGSPHGFCRCCYVAVFDD